MLCSTPRFSWTKPVVAGEQGRDFQWHESQRLLKHAFETVSHYRQDTRQLAFRGMISVRGVIFEVSRRLLGKRSTPLDKSCARQVTRGAYYLKLQEVLLE